MNGRVQIILSPPVVLPVLIGRFALVPWQIDSNTTGSQKKSLVEEDEGTRERSAVGMSAYLYIFIFGMFVQLVGLHFLLDQFFLQYSRVRVNMLSHESKTTAKQGQYNWMAEKKLDGHGDEQPVQAFSAT